VHDFSFAAEQRAAALCFSAHLGWSPHRRDHPTWSMVTQTNLGLSIMYKYRCNPSLHLRITFFFILSFSLSVTLCNLFPLSVLWCNNRELSLLALSSLSRVASTQELESSSLSVTLGFQQFFISFGGVSSSGKFSHLSLPLGFLQERRRTLLPSSFHIYIYIYASLSLSLSLYLHLSASHSLGSPAVESEWIKRKIEKERNRKERKE
jgi:hypothetical protein